MSHAFSMCYPLIIYVIIILYILSTIYVPKISDVSNFQLTFIFSYIIISGIILYILCNHWSAGMLVPVILFMLIPLSFTGDWKMGIFK